MTVAWGDDGGVTSIVTTSMTTLPVGLGRDDSSWSFGIVYFLNRGLCEEAGMGIIKIDRSHKFVATKRTIKTL